jgi:hypothetical protein
MLIIRIVKFQILSAQIASYVVSGVGVICTLIFHASVWNMNESKDDTITDSSGGVPSRSSTIEDFKTVLKSPNFYIVSVMLKFKSINPTMTTHNYFCRLTRQMQT